MTQAKGPEKRTVGGKPRKRNAERSRQLILETALKHFAAKGYDGARIDDIVAETKLSKNLLYHYFGSKEELFVAVLDILNTENLYRGAHIKKSKKIRSIYDPLFVDLNNVLERGKKTGEFRGNIDAVQLYISLSSLIYHYLSNGHTLSVVLKQDLMTKANLAARLKHVTDMVLRFCLPPELLGKA